MTPIAIVGWATRLPGTGTDASAFWNAVSSAADLSTEVPAGRWLLPPERCLDPRVPHPNSVYSARGYYLDPFAADAKAVNVPGGLLTQLDPLFHLVLDVGHRAWRSAKTEACDPRKAGVILGNICLPTDASSALARQYLGGSKPAAPVHPLNRYVAGLPAGLLAKSLGLGAGTFTLDAACASTLYAIKLAADELQSGRADVMLAGGANRSDCLYTQMGFAQLRALSASGRCSPFSHAADGLMVGEGATVFVLKRLPDAERDGDAIQGILLGWGLSNDTQGNLLAPAKEGQLRAMRAAYKMAGWQPNEVDLIECHATGTPVGDAVEFDSLRELWGDAAGRCVIGSVKSTVGHLLTGAGGPAVAKVLLAFRAKTLPPQANFPAANPALDFAGSPFRVLTAAEPWDTHGTSLPRRAAVSGFGFGGVNAHLLLEEHVPDAAPKTVPPGVSPTWKKRVETVPPAEPIAVVGMAAHVGPWNTLAAFAQQALGLAPVLPPTAKRNGWGDGETPCPPGHFVETVAVPIDRFRIPPRELEDMLPQQLLMLTVAADALADAGPTRNADPLRTGVFVGLGLDLNTTNFHLRWAELESGTDATWKPLTADRTLGALGSIAASRIARAFHFGGPSFTCCSEESSSGTAVALAVRALRLGEIDRAVVGGVDLTGDPRQLRASEAFRPVNPHGAADPLGEVETGLVPGEGAAAVVLKRLSDAERDGDRIYAVIRGVGVASGGAADSAGTDAATYASSLVRACAEAGTDPADVDFLECTSSGCAADDKPEAEALSALLGATKRPFPLAVGAGRGRFGHTGAASGVVGLIRAALAVHHQTLPPTVAAGRIQPADGLYSSRLPRFWLTDTGHTRRAAVAASGADGSSIHIVLEEWANRPAERLAAVPTPAPLPEALFIVDGGTGPEVAEKLHQLERLADERTGWPVLALATHWHRAFAPHGLRKYAVTFVARSVAELRAQADVAWESIRHRPEAPLMPDPAPAVRDRVFYSPNPLGPKAQLALVFPGSGNQFAGMGRDLSGWFPAAFRRQQAENTLLRGQVAPDAFWGDFLPPATPARTFLFGQVTLGAAVADILLSLGVKADAMVGLSLGESAGLFGVRAWADRDEMFRRIRESSLFDTDLGPPYDAARTAWGVPAVQWVSGVVAASADDVRSKLRPGLRAYLLIVNTATECVIGGERADVDQLVAALGKTFLPLRGVTLAHCEAGKPVERPYHELHTLPVTPPGVRVYSGAWGRAYQPTSANAADSITAGLLNTLDFPAVVNAAYRDGVRAFVEVGPGASCTRMIGTILGDRPHLARAVTPPRQDAVSAVLRAVAALIAERLPVDWTKLPTWEPPVAASLTPAVRVPVGREPVGPPLVMTPPIAPQPPELVTTPRPVPTPAPRPPKVAPVSPPPVPVAVPPPPAEDPFVAAALNVQTAAAAAHEQFLRVQAGFTETTLAAVTLHQELVRRLIDLREGEGERDSSLARRASEGPVADGEDTPQVHVPRLRVGLTGTVPRSLSFAQCTEFAVGEIGNVLGSTFAEADTFPTRVRLPDGPLMLVDRVLLIEGEPKSMTRGRVVTDHAVRADRWYLDNGRCPTSVTVESGQADLFLAGYLGIDFQTRGLAVYRLLDAVVTFHRELPRVGERIEYDIHIDEFFRQGDSWLFRFRFEGAIDGQPLLSMANGIAGFFTAAALAAGQGIVHTKLDLQPMPGNRPTDWQPLVPFEKTALDPEGVAALQAGDVATAFGPLFADLPLKNPMRLPAGMLRLVDSVPVLDPTGGRFGIGFVRAEYVIRPKEWFIECHFIDDKVMPGTLMYECCLHTLRILLMRMGWVGEEGDVTCEPVPGVASRLKCRGQVLATTGVVAYEVTVKELGFRPEPYCIADALMYADGKPVVEITNLSLRMSGLTEERLKLLWGGVIRRSSFVPRGAAALAPAPAEAERRMTTDDGRRTTYGPESIRAFAVGNPSEAFGAPYRVFDRDRVIARLPGPPYQFLDRVTHVVGEPFVLKDGAACVAEYDVPADEWYFAANRCPRMPFSILLEVALQPCGWLAAYCGSALTSESDLSFRNLGGQGTQLAEVGPDIGTLTTAVTMTKVAKSAGMILQHYDMKVTARDGRPVYEGTTYFGFFAKDALRNQVGIAGAKVPYLDADQLAFAETGTLPADAPFPAPMLRMVDGIDGYLPRGGKAGLGLIQGRIAVDPGFWFFKAHFHQDPVWPGSLGVESFLQLLKFVAWKKWKTVPDGGWRVVAVNHPHQWTYRGQVLPTDREVVVVLEVTAVNDDARTLTAGGFLTVDGRVIYQMANFVLQ